MCIVSYLWVWPFALKPGIQCVGVLVSQPMCGNEDSFQEVTLLVYHVAPRNWTQAMRPSSSLTC